MKTAIIGPGALGCLFAAYLKQGGLEVALVDHRPDRARRIASHGISVQGVRGEQHVHLPVTADAKSLGPAELVFVCVKAYHTEEALRQHRSLVAGSSVVWSVQNGIGNVEVMARVVPEGRIVGGSTTMGATLLEPGKVHHAGEGDTLIGELAGGGSDRVDRIARKFTAAGVPVRVHPDIRQAIWSKLLVNVGINALTAILRVQNGVLLELESARALMEAAVREGVRAAASQGVGFDEAEAQEHVQEVARRTAENRSSMLQDILARRRTEIDTINGAVARLHPAPVNHTLAALVRALEARPRT